MPHWQADPSQEKGDTSLHTAPGEKRIAVDGSVPLWR